MKNLCGLLRALSVITFALALLGSKPLTAQILTYDNLTDFSNDSGSAYFEPFTQFNGRQHVTSPQLFPTGLPTGYKFTLSDNDPSGINFSSHPGQASVFASVAKATDSFVINFPLANVTAFAGTFFLDNSKFNPVVGQDVTVTAYTATSHESVTVASTGLYSTEPFVGFTSATPFTEITVSGPGFVGDGIPAFVSLDSLYLSQSFDTVPEPSTLAMMLGGVGMLFIALRHRSRRAAVLQ